MEDVYRALQKKLDSTPQGFPSTEDGLDIKILRWVFSPEEAKIALDVPFAPESADTIAQRIGKSPEETAAILDRMTRSEQLMCFNIGGVPMYCLPVYYPGFHDCQQFRKDKTVEQLTEYARLFNEYFPSLLKTAGSFEPSLTRVVPVSTAVEAELRVHRLDDVRRMVEEAKSIHLMECVCRKEKALLGQGCNHSLEVCMMLSNQENIYTKWPHGRDVSAQEAMDAIIQAEKEGLVHTTYNADDSSSTFLCACCPCCSIFLSAVVKHKAPHIVTRSNFEARIDGELCSTCGTCADERCPMKAIIFVEEDHYRVQPERCIGCGVCISTCPTGAIQMVRRSESDQESIPASVQEWAAQRAGQRWSK